MVSTEEILLERPRAPGSKAEEPKAAGDPLAQFQKGGGAVLMVCRTCGKKGDHWTSRCPYKDLAPPAEGFVDKPAAAEAATAASVSKAYVDQKTGMSRGFGFVDQNSGSLRILAC
ncbi:hypothetical protein L6164_037544 [Bauhinia variegata]|uniref:Uncharacterized protein n=1 Tax=Bauhinia variegata TaxID=167791 RepID=A0ACB9KKI5_BAUVA|nr:hypothetical protein L6164_037544 [Bauhinia variegata]